MSASEKSATEKSEAEDVSTSLQSMAAVFVNSSKDLLQLEYDYSPKTLQIMDQELAVFHPEGFFLEAAWHAHAAYAGEVIRRSLGGKWMQETNGVSLRGVGGKATIYPFIWVAQRIESVKEGSDANSLGRKYLKLLQVLDRETEAPEVVPTDFVLQHAETQLGGSSSDANGQLDADADTSSISSSELQSDEDGDDDDTFDSSLAMAPTICFFMIAAADGKIDKKEAKSFLTEVIKFATHQNPLIREIFGGTPARFTEFCGAISESAPLAVLKLAICKVAAQKAHPEHADEFCQALFDMSTAIASSSGGLFSRGKVSKDEQKVLDVIAQTLGLKKG